MAEFQSTIELKAVTRDIDKKLRGVRTGLNKVDDKVRNTQGQFRKMGNAGSKSMDMVGKSTKKLEKQVNSTNSRIKALGTSMKIAAALAGTIIAGKAISSAVTFEKSMGAVRATINGTAAEMKALTAESQRLGKTTAFTAVESAEAMTKLAMAGFTADETLKATADTLALAAAGALGLSEAADISSNVLAGFSLKVGDLGRVTDVMAAAAASSNTSVSELGQALSYVGPIAEQSGVSVEETTAAIGKLSDAGIKSSRAGTNVRQMLLKLQKPTAMAQKTLDKLGIATRDSQGHFRGLTTVMKDFGNATSDAADFARVFGIIASSGAGVIAKAAKEGTIQTMTAQLEDASGAAAKMADIRLDNLAGSVTKMTSAWDGLTQTILQGGILNFFRDFVDGMTRLFGRMEASVASFQKNFDKIFNIEATIAGVQDAISDAMWAIAVEFAKFYVLGPVKYWNEFWSSFADPIEQVLKKLKGNVQKGFEKFWESVVPGRIMMTQIRASMKVIKYVIKDGVKGLADEVGDYLSAFERSFVDTANNIYTGVVGAFQKLYMKLIGGSIITDMISEMKEAWQDLADDYAETAMSMTSAVSYQFFKLSDSIKTALSGIQYLAKEVFGKLGGSAAAGIGKAVSAIESQKHLLDNIGEKAAAVGKFSIPVALVLNFDIIRDGLKDIAKNVLEGDFMGALETVARGIDAYLGVAIAGVTKTFETLYSILNSDISEIIARFPKTFEAMQQAIDSITESIAGWGGMLTGPIGAALKGVYNTVQLLLDFLTGIDAESTLGTIVAMFATLKIAAWAWAEGIKYAKKEVLKLGGSMAATTIEAVKTSAAVKSVYAGAKVGAVNVAAGSVAFQKLGDSVRNVGKSIKATFLTIKSHAAVALLQVKTSVMASIRSMRVGAAATIPPVMDQALYGPKGVKGAVAKVSLFGRIARSKMMLLGGLLTAGLLFSGGASAADFGEDLGQGINDGLQGSIEPIETDYLFNALEIASVVGIAAQTGLLNGVGGFFANLFPKIAASMAPVFGSIIASGLAIAVGSGVLIAAIGAALIYGVSEAAEAINRGIWQPIRDGALTMWDEFKATGMGVGEYLGKTLSSAYGKAMQAMGTHASKVIGNTIDGLELRARKLGVDASKVGDEAKLPAIYRRSVTELGDGLKNVTIELEQDMDAIWQKYANTTPEWLKSFDLKDQTEAVNDLINKSVGAGLIQAEDSMFFDNAVDATQEIGEALAAAGTRIKYLEEGMQAGTVSARTYATEIENLTTDLREVSSDAGVKLPDTFRLVTEELVKIKVGQAKLNQLLGVEYDTRMALLNATGKEDQLRLQKQVIANEIEITAQLAKQTQMIEKQFKAELVGLKKTEAIRKALEDSTRSSRTDTTPERYYQKYLATMEKIKTKQEKLNDKIKEAKRLTGDWLKDDLIKSEKQAQIIAKMVGTYQKAEDAWKKILEDGKADETAVEKLIRKKTEAQLAYNEAKKQGMAVKESDLTGVLKGFDDEISNEKEKSGKKADLKAITTEIEKLNLASEAAGNTLAGFNMKFAAELKGIDKRFRDTYGEGWKKNEEALKIHQQMIATMTTEHNKELIEKQEELANLSNSAWDGIQSGISKFFRTSKKTGQAFADAAEQSLGNVKSAVGSLLSGAQGVDLRSALVGMVQPFLDAMIDQGMNELFGALGLGTKVDEPTGNAGDPVHVTTGTDVLDPTEKMDTALTEQWENMKMKMDEAWTGLSNTLTNAWTSLQGGITSAWEGFKGILSSGWESLSGVLSSAWEGLSGILNNAFEGLSSIFSSMGGEGGMGDAISGIGSSIGGFLGFAEGGEVPEPPREQNSPETSTDTVPAMLTPGEEVIDTETVDAAEGEGGFAGGKKGGGGMMSMLGKAGGGIGGLMGGAAGGTADAALMAAATALQAAATALTTSATGLTTAGTGLTTAGTGLTTAGTGLTTSGTTMSTALSTAGTTMSTGLTAAGTTMSASITTASTMLNSSALALKAAAVALKIAAATSYADGGPVKGAGTGTSDSIQAWLSDGEYVINAKSTKKFAPLLEAINSGKLGELRKKKDEEMGDLPTFAMGGAVGKGGTAHSDRLTGGSTKNPAPISGKPNGGTEGATYNTTHINISGNVDQRAIAQIRSVIESSPKQVNAAAQTGTRNESGIRQPPRR